MDRRNQICSQTTVGSKTRLRASVRLLVILVTFVGKLLLIGACALSLYVSFLLGAHWADVVDASIPICWWVFHFTMVASTAVAGWALVTCGAAIRKQQWWLAVYLAVCAAILLLCVFLPQLGFLAAD